MTILNNLVAPAPEHVVRSKQRFAKEAMPAVPARFGLKTSAE